MMMSDEGVTKAFLEFKGGLSKIVRRFVENPVDVEDIVHEAYVRFRDFERGNTL